MKKQLLFGSALVTAFAVNAQNHRVKPTGIVKAPKPNELSYSPVEPTMSSSTGSQNQVPALLANKDAASSGTLATTWQAFAASQNVFGHLVSNSRIINYDENLDVVSYIYRKPCSYSITASSENNSGVMLAKIISKWNPIAVNGTFQPQYDSTAFGSNSTNFPRYPNGGIYNPPGNTNISNAYIVGSGPTTNGSGWTGNWYSSKQLGSANYNNTPSTASNAQQWFANTATTLNGHNFNRYTFSYTDDGLVRSVCTVGTPDNTGSGGAAPGDTSLYITTGTFAGGTFSWTGTELYPDFSKGPADGVTNMADVLMAWNEAGTVGYAIALGQNKTTTVTVNLGIQPRVWKTTNSGASWAAIPNMDFASPSLTMVTNDLPTALAANSTVAVPWFRSGEGMDAVVDKDDRLHLVTTIISHSSIHPDSTFYIWSYGTDRYYFPHVPGARPYIYDFTTTGTTWGVRKIDSLSTEAPRGTAASAGSGTGYTENPWTEDASSKPVSSSRIQLGRTANGNQIYYSWAESDTLITNGGKKWNTFPNVKVRILDVTTNSLSPEFNITSPPTSLGTNNLVKNRAFFHYTSPKSPNLIGSFAGNYTLAIPASVTNNQSLNGSGVCAPETPVIHFFNAATITNAGVLYVNPTSTNSIGENNRNVTNMQVIPNPASNNANLVFDMLTDAKVFVNVTDVTGKVVKSLTANSTLGQNTININVADLTAGIYFVSISANNQKSTAKLIVE